MKNVDGKGAILDFQRKLDAFKAKIRYQQLPAQLLTVEFDSLTCEFESLKQLFGVSLEQIESTTGNFEATFLGGGDAADYRRIPEYGDA